MILILLHLPTHLMKKVASLLTALLLAVISYSQDYAIGLNGSTQYVEVPDNNALDLSANLTFEAWIYPTGAGSHPTEGGIILNKENSYEIGRFTDGTIRFAISGNGNGLDWSWINTGLIAPLNKWTHVALVKNGGSVAVYLDGNSSYTVGSQPTSLTANTTVLQIGSRANAVTRFQGFIDEVRIWNTARTAAEIKTYMFNKNMAVNASGLVAYYRFNEGSGAVAGNTCTNTTGLDGALVNSPTWPVSPIRFAGNALSFDGTDDIVSTNLDLSNFSAFTLEGWIYPRAAADRTAFFGQNDVIEFGFSSATSITGWSAGGSSTAWTFDNSTFPFNTWHHVAFVGNGSSISLYVDGQLKSSTSAATGNYGSSGDRFNMGAAVWDNTGNNFNGIIDEVRVWNVARTATQIQNSMFGEIDPATATGLLAYYNFNQGTATGANAGLLVVPDGKGNKNGSLSNFNLGNGNSTSNFVGQNSALFILPLQWLSFSAEKQGADVLLKWTTANEQNTRDFIVQYSRDNRNWSDLTVIPSANNGAGVNSYSYLHSSPVKGINYYRVLQRDLDGRSSFSAIRAVNWQGVNRGFVVLNNPVESGLLNLQVNEPVEMIVLDATGKVVLKERLSAGLQTMNLSGLPGGIYILNTGLGRSVITKR